MNFLDKLNFWGNPEEEKYLKDKTEHAEKIVDKATNYKLVKAIETFATPLYEIKKGNNSFKFERDGQTMEISFLVQPINLTSISTIEWDIISQHEFKRGSKNIFELLYKISLLEIVINGEKIDLEAEVGRDNFIVAPIADRKLELSELLKQTSCSGFNPKSKIIFSGMPLDNISAFMTIFHEVGHKKFMNELGAEFKKYLDSRNKPLEDKNIKDKANILEEERSAAAFALKNVKKIVKFFDIDPKYLDEITNLYLRTYTDYLKEKE